MIISLLFSPYVVMITYDGKDKMQMNAETKDFPSEKAMIRYALKHCVEKSAKINKYGNKEERGN